MNVIRIRPMRIAHEPRRDEVVFTSRTPSAGAAMEASGGAS
jgi:hypothetical protein